MIFYKKNYNFLKTEKKKSSSKLLKNNMSVKT